MLITILSYLTDICKLSIVIFGILNFKLAKRPLNIAIIFLINIIILRLAFLCKIPEDIITYLGAIAAVLTVNIISDKWSRIFVIFPCYLLISFVDLLSGGIVALITKENFAELLNQFILIELCNAFSLIILVILYSVLKRRRLLNHSSKSINYFLIGVMAIGIIGGLLYIGPILVMGIEMNESKYKLELILGITLSGIILLALYAVLIMIHCKNNYYKENLRISEELIISQKNYFRSILKKEEETKKFRHDITHHINCMLQLQNENKDYNLREYLLNMSNQTKIIKGNIDTGNELINIVLDDVYSNYLDSNIKINWKGYFPENTRFSNMDICILFSNILKNAFESEIRWKEQSVKGNMDEKNQIYIDVKNISNALYIKVINNTIDRIKIEKKTILYTTKNNKRNHGFGTKNINDIIEKYKGELTYTCEGNSFITEVLFENII